MHTNKKTSLYSTFLGKCIGHIGVSNGLIDLKLIKYYVNILFTLNTNQDIKGDKAKIKMTQQNIKLNTGAKEIQQINHGRPVNSQSIRPLPSQHKISL